LNDAILIQMEESTMCILPKNRIKVQGILTFEEQQKHGRLVTEDKHHLKIQYKGLVTHSKN
jgi:hypothetical protein